MHILESNDINNCGVCWPIKTFNHDSIAWEKKVPLVMEASNRETSAVLKEVFSLLPFDIHEMPYENRKIMHMAASMSNNFIHHLLHIVHQILDKYQLPPELLVPLLNETIQNINWDKLSETQTGPAVRGDQKTIQNHLNVLRDNHVWKDLYESITHSIMQTHSEKP